MCHFALNLLYTLQIKVYSWNRNYIKYKCHFELYLLYTLQIKVKSWNSNYIKYMCHFALNYCTLCELKCIVEIATILNTCVTLYLT